ncbi:hypothetical protein [Streptomyces sp. NPDC059168]|uniref:hypothetical protein n=1 Tax=Streptomyces sp. NPDC059168 TaxID=3346753 RepID=UPI003695137D
MFDGALLENAYSLDLANGREQAAYRRNLRRVVDGLEVRFANRPGVSWNTPPGGLCVSVTVHDVPDSPSEVSCPKLAAPASGSGSVK